MAAYNKQDATVNSIIDCNYNTLSFTASKKTYTFDGTYSYYRRGNATEDTFQTLSNKLGTNLKPVFCDGENINGLSYDIESTLFNDTTKIRTGILSGSLYNGSISGFSIFNESELTNLGCTIVGTMPASIDEIAITDYIYKQFKVAGFVQREGKTLTNQSVSEIKVSSINSYNDLLGKYIYLKNNSYKITAIVDTNLDYAKYQTMQEYGERKIAQPDYEQVALDSFEQIENDINYNLHSLVFITDETLPLLFDKNQKIDNSVFYTYTKNNVTNKTYIYYIRQFSSLDNNDYKLFNGVTLKNGNLKDNDVLVDIRGLMDYLFNQSGLIFNTNPGLTYKTAYEEGVASRNTLIQDANFLLWLQDNISLLDNYKIGNNEFSSMGEAPTIRNIAGFTINQYDESYSLSNNFIVGNDNYFNEYCTGSYTFMICETPSKQDLSNIIQRFYSLNESSGPIQVDLNNGVMTTLKFANRFFENSAVTFLYIGIGFAVFSCLMLMNFISTSIFYKKREIGILRALGARRKDVITIFYNESLIISMINFFLSSIVTYCAVVYLNFILRTSAGFVVTLLNFTFRQVILLFCVSVLAAVLSSIFPVYKISKKQPIDAINNR